LPEEQTAEQTEAGQQGIYHHHRIHNHLIMAEPEEREFPDDKGESRN
jgi:hypothetical protein